MGQDTADELNGRFTALQAAAEDIRSMMQVQNVYMSEITDISIESNEHLAAISANTRAIAAISKTIERIEMKVKTL